MSAIVGNSWLQLSCLPDLGVGHQAHDGAVHGVQHRLVVHVVGHEPVVGLVPQRRAEPAQIFTAYCIVSEIIT